MSERTDPPIQDLTNEERYRTPPLFRLGMRLLSYLAPPLAARAAGYLFSLTGSGKVREAEHPVLDRAEVSHLLFEGRRIVLYAWGAGPTVLLLHGWGSRGSRLIDLVDPLTDAGFRVVAWDGPAHGDSEGRTTTGPDTARALRQVVEQLGEVTAVVAHSFGCLVTALALKQGLRLERAVFLSPPADMALFLRVFTRTVGITPAVEQRLTDLFSRRTGVVWSDLAAERLGEGQTIPMLLVHDRDDPVVPLEQAERLHQAWAGSEMVVTTGLGHRMTHRDPEVIARVVSWLTDAGPS